ncbi:MAG TPA: DNA alkylation repair protein [Anaeromyxobacteraceae bacterium]|nr:DNA alkylation repair protein [Anaeromyxobacteraceae bacterium]
MKHVPVAVLARDLEASLRALGAPERAAQEKRYLKSSLVHFGVSVPATRKVAQAFRKAHADLDRVALLALVDALWRRGVYECRRTAVELLELFGERLLPEDLGGVVERLVRESGTWALVDELAAIVAGRLVERFPDLAPTLDRWALDEDFWIRRSALLAELVPLREGRGDFDRFGRHADAMLGETEFFVRKAIGWVLRDTSRRDPERVAAWLLPRAARASGLTLREATKRLPARRRAEILREAEGVGKAPPRSARTTKRPTRGR